MRRLDIFEQILLVVFYVFFLHRLWPNDFSNVNIYNLLLLLSESIVVILLLIRRRTVNISSSYYDWFIALSGTLLPLLVGEGGELFLPKVGLIFLLFGLWVHTGAKLSLLRSFGMVPANRGIRIHGLYRFVRHPMYAGYFFTHIGFLIAAPSLRNGIVYLFTWVFLLSRIFAEEKLLMKSDEYMKYMNKVRYRLLPGVF